jgi:hypothetical protein
MKGEWNRKKNSRGMNLMKIALIVSLLWSYRKAVMNFLISNYNSNSHSRNRKMKVTMLFRNVWHHSNGNGNLRKRIMTLKGRLKYYKLDRILIITALGFYRN